MIRNAISRGLYHTGLLGLWRRLNRSQVSILTIHSVLDEQSRSQWTPLRSYLPAENFRRNLIFLRDRCTFISLAQAEDILSGRAEPIDGATVLTFDDGYMNNFSVALPIMEELNIPGAFFIVSDYIRNRRPFWFDRVDYAIQSNVEEKFELQVLGKPLLIDGSSRSAMRQSMLHLFSVLMANSRDDRELEERAGDAVREVESLKGRRLVDTYDDSTPCAVVTEGALRKAAASRLVTIGSHTHHHVRLPTVSKEALINELVLSRCELQRYTNTPVTTFCYPNGDFDAESVRIVKEQGYTLGLTCIEGTNKPREHDLLTLNRVNWSASASPIELLALACGAYRDSFSLSRKQAEVVDESKPASRSRSLFISPE